jgi:hypothetical protein
VTGAYGASPLDRSLKLKRTLHFGAPAWSSLYSIITRVLEI